MKKHAVFFDRDNTLIYDKGYTKNPGEVRLIENSAECLAKLSEYGFILIVISNQSGIERNMMTFSDVEAVNMKINALLKPYNTKIDKFYFCPHIPESKCTCRKPSPEMVFQASEEFNIDLQQSYFVGDKLSDLECGINAGVKSILFESTHESKEINLLHLERKTATFRTDKFLEICNYIISDFTGGVV